MSAHCHCDNPDPYRVETEITRGAPDGTVSVTEECASCGGLVEVTL